MNFQFSHIFGLGRRPLLQVAPDSSGSRVPQLQIAPDHSRASFHRTAPTGTHPDLPAPIQAETLIPRFFLPTQADWLTDPWPMRIWQKSRQVGATLTDALDSVLKASHAGAKFDVWISSRDEFASELYLQDCKHWTKILDIAATDLGRVILDRKNNSSAYVLEFANGRRIYCLSSNPNAFAGKRGHVKIDEFALHADQRLLYRVAKPVTQWGGTLSIISTHRGPNTLFNQIICDIRRDPAASPWHLYSYPLQKAVEEGLVERINEKSGRNETREEFLARIRAECLDEESWLQEYCCIPSDESSAFITHDMISACEDPNLKLLTTDQLIAWLKSPEAPENPELYLGVDIGRSKDLTVFDLGLKVGNVMVDKLRLELDRQPFHVQERELFRLLALPQLKRACIDRNGNGQEMSERAKLAFGYKVEEVHITASIKEKLAYGLRQAFESLALRLPPDPKLRADIHAMKKIVTATSNIRFDGNTDDSHCDRFMAKALRQEAARPYEEEPWIQVG